jgi:hypothetical protein
MEWLIAFYELTAIVAIVVFSAALLAYRVTHGIRIYFRFRGDRLVTCPETHKTAIVKVAALSMGMQAIFDVPCLRFGDCSRWPIRGGGCAQDCLGQVEARLPELRISGACRAS